VLDGLMRDGTMPHLAAFAARGVRADLRSTPNPITPPAWTSLMTGRSPGHHGILDFVRAEERPAGMYFRITDARDLACETIWSLASRQGRRVTALNFYGMWPPRPIAGHSIPGFVPARHLRRASWPADLIGRLAAVDGFEWRRLGMDLDEEKKCIQGLSPESYEGWVSAHIRRERAWLQALRHLMTTEPSDLTAIVFDGVDKIQHLCWRFVDPTLFPADPSPWERRIRALCLDYFREVDAIFGEVLALAGPDAHVFVVSDHGFGTSTEVVYVNVFLEQQGLLRWAADAPHDEAGSLMVTRLKNHVSLVDWQTTKAYALTPSANGIVIRGVPPADYGAFRLRLVEALSRFADPVTGERVVTGIRTREDAFPGACMNRAPDLTLTLRDGGLVSILNADAPLKPRPEPVGTHRPEGIFLGAGPGIRQGVALPALSILDVTPTLVHLLGLAVPEDYEGRFPEEAFEPEFVRAVPVRTAPATAAPDVGPRREADELDAEEEAVLTERLRQLGYLE